MQHARALLALLADGEYRSGEEIGRRLHVTRAAVWKQIKKLEEMGLPLEACRGRGYRIQGGLSLLDERRIGELLNPTAFLHLGQLELMQMVTSTNAMALERIKEGNQSGYVCLAEGQSDGRGRRGRQWASPFAANIYVSLLMHYESGATAVEGLSLAVGTAVADAMRFMGVAEVQLKWPNDVLWSGRKLGGILLEMAGDPAGACDVVVGVGLNVHMTGEKKEMISQPWVDMSEILGARPDRNEVAAALINTMLPLLANYESRGFKYYRSAWEQLDGLRDEPVVLFMGDQQVTGIARGVDESGSLKIEGEAGLRCYSGGEISLRKA